MVAERQPRHVRRRLRLLRDVARRARFSAQRSADGKTTSFFHFSSPKWDFVGPDTSWDTDVLSAGQAGVLADPQATFVETVAGASSKKLCLLSHHQLVSVYSPDDLGQVPGPPSSSRCSAAAG